MSPGVPVITVDGPSGAGKGTVAKELSLRTGWRLLDSGALYRLVALAARRSRVDLDAVRQLAEIARTLPVEFDLDQARSGTQVRLSGDDVTDEIRTEAAGADASRVAQYGPVRVALLERQRAMRTPPGLVADGRDMGTVVFPDAPLKIYLTASAEERARRRCAQLKGQGHHVSLPRLIQELRERDARDQGRSVAPLAAASDAITIDNSALSIPETVDRVLRLAQQRNLINA
ncbi:MAG: (d)CMP kinase [Pseudomonadota bacterium]|nr:(d)CMP kinase [Pseudomonadota bacterium]